jgi:DNA-binding NtrC family response regulator
MVRLLFIDDEPGQHRLYGEALSPGGEFQLISAYSGAMGIEMARTVDPDVILLDINLQDMSGIDVLPRLDHRRVPVIVLTSYSDTRLVVEAVHAGAFDYVVKSPGLEALEDALRRAVSWSAFRSVAGSGTDQPELRKIVGVGPSVRRLRELVLACSRADAPVCILGETGTGKELVAESIHRLSARRDGQFVAVNCGAIPEQLVETELFGSERGAFTDAATRSGSFERAHRGTLFLDEIGEMAPAAQVKLLRAVERKRVRRVGGTEEVPADARIVAATNLDLRAAVAERRFREDLYYRIGVLVVEVPPLRDRLEDLPLLASHFLRSFAPGGAEPSLSPEAAERLMSHRWPGNIRELRNVLERATVLAAARSDGKASRGILAEDVVVY